MMCTQYVDYKVHQEFDMLASIATYHPFSYDHCFFPLQWIFHKKLVTIMLHSLPRYILSTLWS